MTYETVLSPAAAAVALTVNARRIAIHVATSYLSVCGMRQNASVSAAGSRDVFTVSMTLGRDPLLSL
jgi:hypothetical protein